VQEGEGSGVQSLETGKSVLSHTMHVVAGLKGLVCAYFHQKVWEGESSCIAD
jgi:uncharacterized membrane protein